MPNEFEQIAEHEGDSWVSKDYLKSEDAIEPDEFDEAKLFKGIIKYEDDDGTEHYISTNLFRSLDELYDAMDYLADEYGVDYAGGNVSSIVRAYY